MNIHQSIMLATAQANLQRVQKVLVKVNDKPYTIEQSKVKSKVKEEE